jgi:predicted Ser/Thr protein kinase
MIAAGLGVAPGVRPAHARRAVSSDDSRTPSANPKRDGQTCTDPGSGARAARPSSRGEALGPGDFVDRYAIVELQGAGGMGVVYRARDADLGRDVAVKLLQADDGRGDPAVQRRFLREAQAMARIAHPNLVTVYDVGTFRGRVYLAMEFVHGQTLSAWLRAAPRGVKEVLDVFAQAGAGLRAAHERGVIHRDFKPDNVLVGDDGRVRVVDFGLARSVVEPAEKEEAREAAALARTADGADMLATPLTRTGAVMGTPAYMAPEQHRGRTIDARADQFSFAVALFEGLYGKRPYACERYADILASLLAGEPSEPPPDTDVPPAVRAVLCRALELDPKARYPNMEALLDALEQTSAATRDRRGWGKAPLWAVAALVAIAGAGGSYALWPAADAPLAEADAPLAEADDRNASEVIDPRLGHDGDDVTLRQEILGLVLDRLSDPETIQALAQLGGLGAPPPPPTRDAGAAEADPPAEEAVTPWLHSAFELRERALEGVDHLDERATEIVERAIERATRHLPQPAPPPQR